MAPERAGPHIPSWRNREQLLRLIGEICPDCKKKIFPPRDICPYCYQPTKPPTKLADRLAC